MGEIGPYLPCIIHHSFQACYQRGKLTCPNCGGRIGSFDFMHLTTCSCGQHNVPPVHLVCSRVDLQLVRNSPSHQRGLRTSPHVMSRSGITERLVGDADTSEQDLNESAVSDELIASCGYDCDSQQTLGATAAASAAVMARPIETDTASHGSIDVDFAMYSELLSSGLVTSTSDLISTCDMQLTQDLPSNEPKNTKEELPDLARSQVVLVEDMADCEPPDRISLEAVSDSDASVTAEMAADTPSESLRQRRTSWRRRSSNSGSRFTPLLEDQDTNTEEERVSTA